MRDLDSPCHLPSFLSLMSIDESPVVSAEPCEDGKLLEVLKKIKFTEQAVILQ